MRARIGSEPRREPSAASVAEGSPVISRPFLTSPGPGLSYSRPAWFRSPRSDHALPGRTSPTLPSGVGQLAPVQSGRVTRRLANTLLPTSRYKRKPIRRRLGSARTNQQDLSRLAVGLAGQVRRGLVDEADQAVLIAMPPVDDAGQTALLVPEQVEVVPHELHGQQRLIHVHGRRGMELLPTHHRPVPLHLDGNEALAGFEIIGRPGSGISPAAAGLTRAGTGLTGNTGSSFTTDYSFSTGFWFSAGLQFSTVPWPCLAAQIHPGYAVGDCSRPPLRHLPWPAGGNSSVHRSHAAGGGSPPGLRYAMPGRLPPITGAPQPVLQFGERTIKRDIAVIRRGFRPDHRAAGADRQFHPLPLA